ncbi:MAG: methylenetetrahydrofolate reductase [NAD(P)H] [Candidatus Sumerlaeia bacterium]
MRFSDFYNDRKPAVSFEVFPPKTYETFARLLDIFPRLVALKPKFMSVTYGAMGTTQERTLEIAAMILSEYRLDTACHLTCVGASRRQLDEILSAIYDAGIRHIVALRGDPPKGETAFIPPADGLSHADELVEHIHRFTAHNGTERFGIAVAGYPEKHVEAPDMATDLLNLKRKVDAGADCVITQLFFDNALYYRFVEQARRVGVGVPIVPGLLPIQSAQQILRMTAMCGATIPSDLRAELAGAADDDKLARKIGVRRCIAQARDLLEHGVPGIHFYVLNRADLIEQIMAEIQDLL